MKIALIGDPHAKLNSLDELSAINQYIISLRNEGKVDKAIFLGDLFDTHSIMRIEIWNFWQQQIEILSEHFKPDDLAIVSGNHDKPGSYEKEHLSAVSTLDSTKAHIVYHTGAIIWNDDFAIVPYFSKEEDFLDACESVKNAKYLICHQTFDGAKYDNGMFAPGGFDPNKVPHSKIISGHIHSTMEFGKVFYPGTARWDSASDANKSKGIYVLNTENDSYEFYSTSTVVTPMYAIEIKENDELPQLVEKAKYAIHLTGTSKWINKIKNQYKGHKIKATYTDSLLKRDQYIPDNFSDYLTKLNTITKKEDILKLIEEL